MNSSAVESDYNRNNYEITTEDEVISFIFRLLNDFPSEEEIADLEDIDLLDSDSATILYDLLMRMIKNMKTILISLVPFYDDRFFNSSYSLYYYTRHFKIANRCSRLFLYDNELLKKRCEENKKLSNEKQRTDAEVYETAFIGSLVIKPIRGMEIGHTIIDPKYLYEKNSPYNIRTAFYSETMRGIRMHIYGFPFSMQDGETVTCSETTILNIVDYFSRRYQAYRSIYPHEVSDIIHANSYDRNIPSRGLSYRQISKIFMEVGFYPRLYAARYERERFLEILNCYVSSGIPVAMGIDNGGREGHSIVAVGTEGNIFENSEGKPLTVKDLIVERIPCSETMSTVFISVLGNTKRRYIFMDDGRAPYTVGEVEQTMDWSKGLGGDALKTVLHYGSNPYDCHDADYKRPDIFRQSNGENLNFDISFLTVPLSKEMAREAEDAIRCFKNLLGGAGQKKGTGYTHYILKANSEGDVDSMLVAGNTEDNPLLMRVFLCASRSLKKHRYETMSHRDREQQKVTGGETEDEEKNKLRDIYRRIHMPRFVWVCELYSLISIRHEKGPRSIGEIVIDATTNNSHKSYDIASVISINYPQKIAYRAPDDKEDAVIKMLSNTSTTSEFLKLFSKINEWEALEPFRFDDVRVKKKRGFHDS